MLTIRIFGRVMQLSESHGYTSTLLEECLIGDSCCIYQQSQLLYIETNILKRLLEQVSIWVYL